MSILVVDDDRRVNEMICDIFDLENIETVSAYNGEQAITLIDKRSDIDLVILDIMMPVLDGWDTLEYIKKKSDAKVIILTALSGESDEVRAIRSGADDYVAKPFKRAVLLERAKRLISEKQTDNNFVYCSEDLELNLKERKVFVDGNEVRLTAKEFNLLELFLKNEKIVLTRDSLLDKVWGYEYFGSDRTIDTHIKMLRRAIGRHGEKIRTVRGVGYSFDAEVTKR